MSTIVGNTIVYSIAAETGTGALAPRAFDFVLKLVSFTVDYLGASVGEPTADTLIVYFDAPPGAGVKTILDAIVAAHNGVEFSVSGAVRIISNADGSVQLCFEDESQPNFQGPFAFLKTEGGLFRIGPGSRVLGGLVNQLDAFTINEFGAVGMHLRNLTTASSSVSTTTAALGVANVYRMLTPGTTLTISSADIVEGRVFVIRAISAGAGINRVFVDTEGGETIDGAASVAFQLDFSTVVLHVVGGNLETSVFRELP